MESQTITDASQDRAYKPRWLTLLRIVLAVILIVKGMSFFKDSTGLEGIMQTHTFDFLKNNAASVAFFITYFNLLGGFFIGVGLFTRWVCLLQIPIVIGAIFFVNVKEGISFSNTELALSVLVLVLLLVFVIKGSGTLSSDEFFRTYTKAGNKDGYTKKFFQ